MICRRCRQKTPPGAESCPKCGASLAASAGRRRPGSGHPILDAIARTAARLCEARDAQIILIEGATQRLVAQHGSFRSPRKLGEPYPLSRGNVYGRAALERRVIHIRDFKAVVRTEYPDIAALPHYVTRVRTMLAAPLFSGDAVLGVIGIRRLQVLPFTSKQIALLQTFAAQAAIAIEKDRLTEQLESRNRELTEALAHQTATGEVLSVISASPTNVQSVFETIVSSARRLCEASFSSLNLLEGDQLMLTAVDGIDQGLVATARQSYPQPVNRSTTSGRAILERSVVHIEDTWLDPEYTNPVRSALRLRSVLTVPMFREGLPIGAVSVWRSEVKPFTDKQIALLQTFADQAVIAIANARLFRDLTEALEQQTATSEILGVISTSTMDAQPVFQSIAEAAVRLSGALFGSVSRFDGELVHMVARHNYPPAALEFSLRSFPCPLSRRVFTARAILERAVVHVPDVLHDKERAAMQELADVGGFRSVLSVPMLRDGVPIGAITVWGSTVGPFSDRHIALLKTFADQAVIAVENVRLFKELEARNRDLTEGLERETATGEILRVISSSPTDIQPVLEAILDSGKRLCDAEFGAIFRFDGDAFVIAASTMVSSEFSAWLRSHPIRPGPATPLTRVGLERRPVQVADILANPDFTPPDVYRREGMRTALAVPMLKDGALVGALTFHRHTVQPFTDQQIALLETFAAQAVIAIENVRLFTELEARNHDLTQALEQQTATAEVLRVIGSSPTDAQPVFDAIVSSAWRLLGGFGGAVYRVVEDQLHLAAYISTSASGDAALRGAFPRPLSVFSPPGEAIRRGAPIILADIDTADWIPDDIRELIRKRGDRGGVWVPMMREGVALGAIGVTRSEPGSFSDEQIALLRTFADQAVIAIENVRLFKELEMRNRDLTDALEQQTATAEILRVISTSPTNLQPVLDTLVASAARFCGAYDVTLFRIEGNSLRFPAHYGPIPMPEDIELPLVPGHVSGRAVLEGRVVHVADIKAEAAAFPEGAARAESSGHRTTLAAPLLREGAAIGVLLLRRMEVNPFSDKQIALLQTFADQAVIAIENVRLFTELQEKNRALTQAHAQVTETLEQQTATSEILRTIAHAQTDVQPVFDTIVRNAAQLCQATSSLVWLLEDDRLRIVAPYNLPADSPMELGVADAPNLMRVFRDGTTHHIGDTENDSRMTPQALKMTRATGTRALLVVPMRRDGEAIGALAVLRRSPGTFTTSQVDLLKTFADQAVIAIENVRLFNELETRNRDLTEALEQQTATAEVLRVISTSPTNLQPVLDTLVASAARFCGAYDATLFQVDGDVLRFPAHYGPISVPAEPSIALVRGHVSGRAVLERRVVHVADVQEEPAEFPDGAAYAKVHGHRTILAAPLMREGAAIGALLLRRAEVSPFTDKQIALLETFADQAVIAIENVRLFTELGARNRDLSQALEQQTATAEVLRVIGSSPTDTQPVFDAIVQSARRLLGGFSAGVYRRVSDEVHVVAYTSTTPAGDAAVRSIYPRPLAEFSGPGEAIRAGTITVSTDIETDPRIAERVRAAIRVRGFRSAVWVPMLREGAAIGAIGVTRSEPGSFADEQIALLKTFADQAVIAIENVRLFKELEARNHDLTETLEQQTATAEILRVISTSPTNLQPVLDTVVASAARFCGAYDVLLFQPEAGGLRAVAHHGPMPAHTGDRARREEITRGNVRGRAFLDRKAVHIADLPAETDEFPEGSADARRFGHRTILSVPLLREGAAVGVIHLRRTEVDPFTDKQIALLQTFADQAVIAIENVRLFTELEARNRDLSEALEQQTATANVLRIIAQSPAELQPVLDAIADSAVRLCAASDVVIERLEGDRFYNAAHAGTQMKEWVSHSLPLTRRFPGGRAVLERRPIIIDDMMLVAESEYPDTLELLKLNTVHSCAEIPLLSEGKPLGSLAVLRAEVRPFTDTEIALLQTFADQAVIAIENVRLFKELEARNRDLSEALEQQTATAEILRVISTSPTNLQPVLDTLVASAARFCGAHDALLFQPEEGNLRVVAHHGPIPAFVPDPRPVKISRENVRGRAFLDRQTVHVPDVQAAAEEFPAGSAEARAHGHRTILSVPLLREGAAVGLIHLRRTEVAPFSDKQIALLQTFADQAVIAIENVRLFKELEARNRDLTVALEQQTATSEILRRHQPVADGRSARVRHDCPECRGAV